MEVQQGEVTVSVNPGDSTSYIVNVANSSTASQRYPAATTGRGPFGQSAETGEHKCRFCGRILTQKSSLKLHERLHTGERPFRCRICERAFIRDFSRKAHERIHFSHKPFTCTVCGRGFYRQFSLKKHVDNYHGDKKT